MEEFKYLIPEESIDAIISNVGKLREIENNLLLMGEIIQFVHLWILPVIDIQIPEEGAQQMDGGFPSVCGLLMLHPEVQRIAP